METTLEQNKRIGEVTKAMIIKKLVERMFKNKKQTNKQVSKKRLERIERDKHLHLNRTYYCLINENMGCNNVCCYYCDYRDTCNIACLDDTRICEYKKEITE